VRAKLPLALALLALCLAAAVGTNTRHTSALTNCAADGTLDSEEQAFLQLITDYRQQNGLAPLSPSDTLDDAAAWKSQNMAANSYFSHDDTPINRTWVQRIRDCDYGYNTYLGENIAAGISSAADAFSLWKSSPGHNANMLGANYSAIGIGRAYVEGSTYGWYWTTDFGGIADGYTPGSTPTPTSTRTSAPTATSTRTPAPPPASYPCVDFDHDGIVRVADIVYVVSRYSTSDPIADIDRSGAVRVTDILIVLSEYGTHCTG
jgi:uncharacterized protein YkwD